GVVLCLDNDDAIEFITLEVNPPPILYTLLADLASKFSLWYADRHETNANVIKKFYTDDELEAVLVAKSDVLVDALAAGPLAA
ncbi:hypothetical protein BGU85_27060, partial [Clostridioides difficile]|uniref:cell wall-binding repeat-containing protein n=1 Tax=Clostridioides difficile TaxID=1496 RepID=UPI000BD8EA35